MRIRIIVEKKELAAYVLGGTETVMFENIDDLLTWIEDRVKEARGVGRLANEGMGEAHK